MKPPSVENATVVTKIMCADVSLARTRKRPGAPVSTTATSPSLVPRHIASPSRALAAAETGSRVARIDPACFQRFHFSSFVTSFGVHLETYPSPFTFKTVATSPSARKTAARYDATTRAFLFFFFP